MKKNLILIITTVSLFGCSSLTPTQRTLLTSAETLAGIAATAAATYYGGPQAGALASAGLSALATVMQGYVGQNMSAALVQNSPGIQGVGQAVVNILPTNPVSQKTVDTVNKASAIAATLQSSNLVPITAPSPAPATP